MSRRAIVILAARARCSTWVMRLRGGEDTYAYVYTAAHDALRRLGACWSNDAARRAVERAVGTEEVA
jgi:hypothetical protein